MNSVNSIIGMLLASLIFGSVLATQTVPLEPAAGSILGNITGAVSNGNITNATAADSTLANATSDLLKLQSQQIDVNVLPSINTTTLENVSRAGILNYGGLDIPVIYKPLGDENSTTAAAVFEGDIILGKEEIGGKAAHDRFITIHKWTNGIIPVVLHPDVPNRDNIIDAMIYIMQNNPVLFRPAEIVDGRITDENYVVFVPSAQRCASNLGMRGGAQAVFVPNWCTTGLLVHELGHTLGLWHEQTRCDRDTYIDIIEENIKPDWISQFNVVCDPSRPEESPVAFGEYDYCSIMHYPRYGSQSPIDPNRPIIEPLNEVTGCTDIGLYNGFSQGDYAVIDSLY
jgi:hypothetical protein